MGNMARLGLLLQRLCRRDLPSRVTGRFDERRNLRSAGLDYDAYAPRGAARRQVVVVHGVTLNAKDEPRLVHLCRCLASVGIGCFAPSLPGLRELRWESSDVEALTAFTLERAGEAGPVGLIGFSFGASYALLAAAGAEADGRVAFVLSFGAYHSLEELYGEFLASVARAGAEAPDPTDDWLYLRLVAAYRHRDRLALPEESRARLESLLRRYCLEASVSEKRSFFREQLGGRDPVPLDFQLRDPETLERLSPAHRLGGLRCPVGLLHDPADPLIPDRHARRIADELGSAGRPCRLAISPVLQHVSLTGALRVGGWLSGASVVRSVLRDAPGEVKRC